MFNYKTIVCYKFFIDFEVNLCMYTLLIWPFSRPVQQGTQY